MGRFARVIVIAVIVVAGLMWGAGVLYRHRVYGTVFTEAHLSVTVEVGDRFSLAVPDRGPSAAARAAGPRSRPPPLMLPAKKASSLTQ